MKLEEKSAFSDLIVTFNVPMVFFYKSNSITTTAKKLLKKKFWSVHFAE